MAGLLEGFLSKAIYAGFKGKLLNGTLKRTAANPAEGLDARGDPAPHSSDVATWITQGFVDQYSAFYRAQAGIPDTDLKVCIFAESIPGIRPIKDDQASFVDRGVITWYQLRNVRVDPATALWECQAYVLQAETAACRARGF